MTVHELKTINPYFTDVWEGRKDFELRAPDRNFQVGDMLILREFDPETCEYSGRVYKKRIVYILVSHVGLTEGWVILGMDNRFSAQ